MEGDDLWSAAVTGDRDYYSKPEVNKPKIPPRPYNKYPSPHNNVDQDYGNLRDYSTEDRPRFFAGKKSYDEGQYKYEDTQNYQHPPTKRPNVDYANRSKFNLTNLKNTPPERSNFGAGNNYNRQPPPQVKDRFESPTNYKWNRPDPTTEERPVWNKQNPTTQGRQTWNEQDPTSQEKPRWSKEDATSPGRPRWSKEDPQGRPSFGNHNPLYNKNQRFPTPHAYPMGASKDGILLGRSHDDNVLFFNTRDNSGTDKSKVIKPLDQEEQDREDYNRYHYKRNPNFSSKPKFDAATNDQDTIIDERIRRVYNDALDERALSRVSDTRAGGNDERSDAGRRSPRNFNYEKSQTEKYYIMPEDLPGQQGYDVGLNKRNVDYRDGQEFGHEEDQRRGDYYRPPHKPLPSNRDSTDPVVYGDRYRQQDSYNGNERVQDYREKMSMSRENMPFGGNNVEKKSNKEDIKQMLIDAGNKSVLSYRKNREEKSLNPVTNNKIANTTTSDATISNSGVKVVGKINPMVRSTATVANRMAHSATSGSAVNRISRPTTATSTSTVRSKGSAVGNRLQTPVVQPLVAPGNPVNAAINRAAAAVFNQTVRPPATAGVLNQAVRPVVSPGILNTPVRPFAPPGVLNQAVRPFGAPGVLNQAVRSVANQLVNPLRMVAPPMRYVPPLQYFPRIPGATMGRPNMPIIVRYGGPIPAGAIPVPNPFLNTFTVRPNQGPAYIVRAPHAQTAHTSNIPKSMPNIHHGFPQNVSNPKKDVENHTENKPRPIKSLYDKTPEKSPIPIETVESKKERKRLLQDALKQIDARKDGSNWKGNPKKPWFDYQCHTLHRKRLRKLFRLRKAKSQKNEADINEIKESLREIDHEYIPMIKERKAKYLLELEKKGMYEMSCSEVVQGLVDTVVAAIKREKREQRRELQNKTTFIGRLCKSKGSKEIIVIDDDSVDAEDVDDENEESIDDEEVDDMKEDGEDDEEVYQVTDEVGSTEEANKNKVEVIKEVIEVKKDTFGNTKNKEKKNNEDKKARPKKQTRRIFNIF